ncbi:MAG: aldehyde dehydrogenase family protein [Elusimicrobiota bacterium]
MSVSSLKATEAEIAAKAAAARRASQVWSRNTIAQRVRALRSLWRALAHRREEIAFVVNEDIGKPFVEFELMEFAVAGLLVNWMTSAAERVLGDKGVRRPWIFFNKRAYERRVPYGVVSVITPWNMPFLIPFGDAFAAMLAGNSVLLKPSPHATKTALWLEAAVAATGFLPEGIFSVVSGDAETGERLVDAADLTLFTGSAKTGRAVAGRAASQLKPAILELGGKHSMIVLGDAPLERAAAAAVWGACANSGQLCVSIERIFVEAGVYDRFVELLRPRVSALRASPDGRGADLGRLALPAGLERVVSQLEDARQKGARVIGGDILDREKLLLSPALVVDARLDMRVMLEETFGPVIAVMRVAHAEEAVALNNAGAEGLSASVWTNDLAKGERLAALLEVGMVGVNEPATHYAFGGLPFGGMKQSGIGRRHGDQGLLALTQAQSVIVHEWPSSGSDPWWFPYDEVKSGFLRRLLGLP